MRSREDSQSEKLREKNRHFFSERFGRIHSARAAAAFPFLL
jgi:hypothetical protein